MANKPRNVLKREEYEILALKNAFGYIFLFHRPAISVTIPNVSSRFDSGYVPPPAYSESIKM